MALDKTGLARLWAHIVARLGEKVDKADGMGLSTNDYTTTEKNKLANIEEGATRTVVDSVFSSTSTNPVQNRVVDNAISNLNTLVGDTSVSSQISSAIANKVDKVDGKGLSTNDYTTEEKNKLAGITSGAEVNQNAFSNVVVGSTTIAADSKTDSLTIVAGDNITLTPDATNDKLTITAKDTVYTHPTYTSKSSGLYKVTVDGTGHVSATTAVAKSDITDLGIPGQDTTYSTATQSDNGLMSSGDKTKLDGIETGANKTVVDSALSATSTNPVQNKIINTAISNLNTLVGDTSVSNQITDAIDGLNLSSTYIAATQKGAANGLAELDSTGKVPSAQLPSYVDDVLEYSAKSSFPSTGETGKIYVDTTTNLTYRWSGSAYVEISPSLALGTTSSTAFRGDYGNTAYTHATAKGSAFAAGLYKITTNDHGHVTAATAVVKSDITGLGIPAQDTTYSAATTSEAGLMSASDKAKLDGIATGANKTTVDSDLSSTSTNPVQNKVVNTAITNLNTLVGDTAVSEQISSAVSTKADIAQGTYAITTEGDGAAYTATVPSITSLTAGVSFIMVPHVVSTTTTPTLNVNGLGAKNIRRRLSSVSTGVQTGYAASWLAKGLPFRVVYDGNQWIVEGSTRPAATDLYGKIDIGTQGKVDGVTEPMLIITDAEGNIIASTTFDGSLTINGDLTVNGTITATKVIGAVYE